MKKTKHILLLVIFLLVNIAVQGQCTMCRSAVESTMSNGRNLAGVGLNTGIIYLLLAPYILVAAVGYFWYKTSQKNRLQKIQLENQVKKFL
jgi:hypothetical protein